MGSSVRRVIARVLVVGVLLAVIVGAVFAYMNRQTIRDHFDAQNFQASPEVVALVDRIDLTVAGERVFLASAPTLDASQNFNAQCAKVDHSEEGHVLGCYSGGRIHLFEVTDERLNGIIEVTTVHELLHAAFARLSDDQRSELADQLYALYEELAAENPVLEERMSVYAGLSRIAFANELHSVLGTEVAVVPDWLEQHYAQWLNDRAAIVAYFESYHAIFDELKTRAAELQSQMAALREDVEARSAVYDDAVQQFYADWESFVQRNEAFEFSDNPDEFYRLRDEFYERRDALGAEMRSLNADIERYEQMRAELLELSELNHELEQQLDSGLAPPAPAPTQEV